MRMKQGNPNKISCRWHFLVVI